MKKIIRLIIRLSLFIFSYFIYLINLIFICLKFKNISKYFFIYASLICSRSLGLTYKLNKEFRFKLLEKGIHISNHDHPLDIFVAQSIFRLPTITTVDQHLKKILPFFEICLRNFGHFQFNHLDHKDRKSAYLFLKKICNNKKSVLIYPSGSIYTGIDKRFSRSISKLSINNGLKVIAWQLDYKDISKKYYFYKKDVLKFILTRFISEEIELYVKKVKIFIPKDYSCEQEYHDMLLSFYKD